jgi:hypothetical protein
MHPFEVPYNPGESDAGEVDYSDTLMRADFDPYSIMMSVPLSTFDDCISAPTTGSAPELLQSHVSFENVREEGTTDETDLCSPSSLALESTFERSSVSPSSSDLVSTPRYINPGEFI